MVTLSSSISNYMWGVIAFISGSGLLILGINSIVRYRQSLPKFILIIRIITTISMTVACYSAALANYLIDKGYSQLSNYFLVLSGVSLLIIFINYFIFKLLSRGRY